MSIFALAVLLPKESVPGLPWWGRTQLLIPFLFWPIHGALVSWLIKGLRKNHPSLLGLLASIILWFLSEAHWDCSCVYPDPRRTPELHFFVEQGSCRSWTSSDCFSITASPPCFGMVAEAIKRKDSVCVCCFSHPTLRWVRFTFSGWKDRLQDQRLVP